MSHATGPDEEMPERELEGDTGDDAEDEFGVDEEEEEQYEREPDPPEIGETVGGSVLVCRGDDQPDDFVGWLEWVVRSYHELERLTDRYGLDCDEICFSNGLVAFLESGGVSMRSSHWEGSCISGIFQEGWVAADEESAVETRLDEMLTAASASLRVQLLESLQEKFSSTFESMELEELASLNRSETLDLCKELKELHTKNDALKAEVHKLEKRLGIRHPPK